MRQQEGTSYERRTIEYIDGNTVRTMEAAPRRRSEEVHRELERKQENDRIERERKRNARAAARKNQERALAMNPGYVCFLGAAMAVLVGISVTYLHLQSEITTRMKSVASLESQVMELQLDNDAALKRIDTSVDLQKIKNTAMGELGMVYPSKDQIIEFQVDETDYMNQYEDIPEK